MVVFVLVCCYSSSPGRLLALRRLFTATVARHPDYKASLAAQTLHAKVEVAVGRIESIQAGWLEAFLSEIEQQDLLGEEAAAGSTPAALAPLAPASAPSASPSLPSVPKPSLGALEAAKRPVSQEEWEATLAALAPPPSAAAAASSGAGGPPRRGGAHAVTPGVTVPGPAVSARLGPGIGDPADGTMGWCRGYEGGRGLSTLMCGGLLKNVLGWPTSDLGRLRHLFVPAGIVPRFVDMAAANSAVPPRGIETCGILAGRIMPSGDVSVTTLVVPEQKGDPDSCELTPRGEMQVFEACSGSDLVQIGWIHTHPSQECFMSSYDVRTHLGFQTMLPEAVAIVAAPRDSRLTYGMFRLIEPDGVEMVRSRPTNQHYLVPDGVFIYETTSHVRMVAGRHAGARGTPGGAGRGGTPLDADDFVVLDLRDGR